MTREIVSVNLKRNKISTTIVSKKDFDLCVKKGILGSMDYDQAVKNGDIFFIDVDGTRWICSVNPLHLTLRMEDELGTYCGKIAGSLCK